MINKIVVSFFFFDLVVAMLISLYWVANDISYHQITIGPEFLSFLRMCSSELNGFKIEIPDIPSIPKIEYMTQENAQWYELVLNFLVNIFNGLITFLNGVVNILNFVVTIINVIIQVLEFLFILIKNIFNMTDALKVQNGIA